MIRGVAQLASAPRSGRGGRRFESSHPDYQCAKVQNAREKTKTPDNPSIVRCFLFWIFCLSLDFVINCYT